MDLSKYVRYYGTPERLQKLLRAGRCPACELRLASTYHTDCPYLDDLARYPQDDVDQIVDKL